METLKILNVNIRSLRLEIFSLSYFSFIQMIFKVTQIEIEWIVQQFMKEFSL